MRIEIIDDSSYLTNDQTILVKDIVEAAAKRLGLSDKTELDISIVDNPTIHQLNLDYRGIDRPTDVLSFALREGEEPSAIELLSEQGLDLHLGDIIISYPKIVEQAQDYGHSFERELAFLTVHGFLHLNGYDHQTSQEEAEMFALQNEVLDSYGLIR